MKINKDFVWQVFKEIVREAKDGDIVIDDWHYHMGFFIKDADGTKPILFIHNEDAFSSLLFMYINEVHSYLQKNPKFLTDQFLFWQENGEIDSHYYVKALLTFLLANMTYDDFLEPEEFILRKIHSFDEKIFQKYVREEVLFYDMETMFGIFSRFSHLNLLVKRTNEPLSKASFHALEFTLQAEKESYTLPKIYYEINNGTCFITGIQRKKEEKTKFHKDLERVLYKIDHDVPGDYKNIEPNILFSLTLFFAFLEKEEIYKVEANAFYPLQSDLKIYKLSKNVLNEEMYQRIFYNTVNRFFEAFARLAYHFPEYVIISYPTDYKMSVGLEIHEKLSNSRDDILNDIKVNAVNSCVNVKRV